MVERVFNCVRCGCIFFFTLVFSLNSVARAGDAIAASVSKYDVTWNELGTVPTDSMPIGNGDIGLNVWTEKGGDICFYIGKTDAWSETNNLLKLGRVRISLNPNPFADGAAVTQTLRLYDGQMEIIGGSGEKQVKVRLWVDANRPVIRVQIASQQKLATKVAFETWRTAIANKVSADVIAPGLTDRIEWYHYTGTAGDAHLRGWTFGGAIKAVGMVKSGEMALASSAPTTRQSLSVYALTLHPSTPDAWKSTMDETIKTVDATPVDQAEKESQSWWHDFWNRSWIFASGDQLADETSRGYALSRFVMGCSERGAFPIKFNGNIFVVDEPWDTKQIDKKTGKVTILNKNADFRAWGGQYWFQNTRPMYWSRLMAGDFDLMLPLFRMFRSMLAENAAQVKEFYGHDGAYFAETAPFYGGIHKLAADQGKYTDHYFTPILELTAMMLDYFDYTQDKQFAKETLLPIATAGLTFFDQHWKRGANGKLLLDPDNAIEMFWRVHDPAPDIAALHYDIGRLLELPEDLVNADQRATWTKLQSELPDLPTGMVDGRKLLFAYTGPQTQLPHNSENPELYAIYPFRIYGLGKPDYQLAIDTFNARRIKTTGCWVQDPVQAAYLGMTALAEKDVHFDLTRSDKHLKFPAFWDPGHDYDPDEDNGGNGENGFQKMLMHCDGKRILLLPAWPKEWDANFKLAAPYQTTVQGTIKNGRISDLIVTPQSRKADVVMGGETSATSP